MKTLASLAIVSAALLLSGCGQSLSPKMAGLSQTKNEAKASRAVAVNSNWRMLNDDWRRMWLTDNPSRLSPMPVTDTSGQPR